MILSALFGLTLVTTPPHALSRPEKVREGISYYSNDYIQMGEVRDLADEKNLEEVYQFYTYYEASYDARGRVIVFKEYKKGNVIYEERYIYNDEGDTPGTKTVLVPGKEPRVVHIRNTP
jgi:hypothetical protein